MPTLLRCFVPASGRLSRWPSLPRPRLSLPLLRLTLPLLLLLGFFSVPAQAQNLKISEFRLSGPGGSTDEFIEISNPNNAPFDAAGWSVGSSAIRITIPAGKAIPAYGYLLLTGSAYSLSDYGGAGKALGDVSYSADIPAGSLMELRNTTGALVDQVNAGVLPAPLSASDDYAYVRRQDAGYFQDTDNDLSDFNVVDAQCTVGPDNVTGVSAGLLRLGAPNPQNRKSLVPNNSFLAVTVPANAVVRTGSGNSGTLSVRRTLTNAPGSGRTARALRIQMVGLTAGTAATATTAADVRLISSISSDGVILPVLRDDPPSQPNGGGLGSSGTVNLSALPGGGLAPGQSITVEFTFQIFKTGTYRFLLNLEPDPVAAQPDIAVRLMEDDEDVTVEPPGTAWTGLNIMSYGGTPNQTISSVTTIGLTRRYALQVTNAGDDGMVFKVTLPAPPTGWTVHLFDALSGGNDITAAAQNGSEGWATLPLTPGGTLPLRLEITPSATAIDVYDAYVRILSSNFKVDTVKVASTVQKLSKLQWSRDGQSWTDVASSPLSVDQYEVIAFRAVPTQATLSWDALPDFKPLWSSQGEVHWGETVWQHFPTPGSATVTAECGNQMSASVQVTEAP